MTVSRALRHDRAVSIETRARVEKSAHALHYRPDPHLGKLMSYLRSRRKPAHRANLCALTDAALNGQHRYLEDIVSGTLQRAESLGYGCTVFHLGGTGASRSHLQRVLVSRGVEGIVLLPMKTTTRVDALLDWQRFSVVSTTRSVQSPIFHEIVPDHFRNMLELCGRLTGRGYRRIGLVLHRDYVLRVNHAFNAAAAWHAEYLGPHTARSYIFEGASPRHLVRWFRRHRPDVLVTNTAENCHAFAATLGLSIPGPVAFATTNVYRPEALISGLDERPQSIGATAVEQLAGLVQRGEKGIPTVPTTMSVRGEWLEAKSCPSKTAARSPRRATELLFMEQSGQRGG